MDKDFDFSGWATKNNILCSDGRIIRKDAFKHNDGQKVPLVWNHSHNDPTNVLGHALLENRDEGVYAYCRFNETEAGKTAKIFVQNGDVTQLSIYANRLQQQGPNVMHGEIREVSLVLAGANPEAHIESVIQHGEELEDEGVIFSGEDIVLHHADEDDEEVEEVEEKESDEKESDEKESDDKEEEKESEDKTVAEVFETLNEEQKKAVYFVLDQALNSNDADEKETEEIKEELEHSEGGNNNMKKNVFDQNEVKAETNVLSHADQEAILDMAKKPGVGSLREAMSIFAEQNETLAHGFEAETLGQLFPEYKNLGPAAPEFLDVDNSWVDYVISKVHKSPISRIRTRKMDLRDEDFRALGYNNREIAKKKGPLMKLLKRTTDPQTVYRKDELHRDDIIDITDFDVVAYQYGVMRQDLKRELALAYLIGDGRDDADEDKIHENHIRSIWNDEELYTIHADLDIAKMKNELQGSNTSANFGENYIYAEAMVQSALYAREKYKGSGNLDLFCTPHLLNVMLLARDLNGRRIYNSKADLAAALNVNSIHTIEQFEGKTRTTEDGKVKKLLGLFVNLSDYTVGATKGGEITKFEDFDIDFNKFKYLIETRQSGTLTKVFAAIALEEPVEAAE